MPAAFLGAGNHHDLLWREYNPRKILRFEHDNFLLSGVYAVKGNIRLGSVIYTSNDRCSLIEVHSHPLIDEER